MSKVWMEITRDNLALLVAVANSAAELARIVGTSENVIRTTICHDHSQNRLPKYLCVILDEDNNT